MASIERFEDIRAWQKARVLTRKVYEVSSKKPFAQDFGLRDQIRRASVSVMSNIAEGFDRVSDRDFRRFLVYAKGSAGEVQSQLYVALDTGKVSRDSFDELYRRTDEVARMLSGLMKYLGGRRT